MLFRSSGVVRSVWEATAVEAPLTHALEEDVNADVAIVGGGYAGLSTALSLAQRGVNAIVLEAREVGFGGSGRNGGQVIPGLKYDPDELVQMFGDDIGDRLIRFAGATANNVFSSIERYGMRVPYTRSGWIQCAHSERALEATKDRARQWAVRGARVKILNKGEIEVLLGTSSYEGGWLDYRGGCIQPLSYARELARVAMRAGAKIYTQSPVVGLSRKGSGWEVRLRRGAHVKAERVVLCTNAYSDHLWGKLRKSIVDANAYQVATERLPQEFRSVILPEGHVASDTRRNLLYFRLDQAGRLLMGGRGPYREPRGRDDWRHLESMLFRVFPELANFGPKIVFRWCGRVAITRDHLPHVHEPEPGVLVEIGGQGRGVGLQVSMGEAMAEYITTGCAEVFPMPLTPIKALPLHILRRVYVEAIMIWNGFIDESS